MKFPFVVCTGFLALMIAAASWPGSSISSLQADMTELFEKVKPSVVTVVYTVSGKEHVSTGIVMDKEGHVLATKDFPGEPSSVNVETSGGKRSAKLVGYDGDSRIAVLKVDGSGLFPARLGDSSTAGPATWVMIVGNSMGISHSVATGVVCGSRSEDGMLQVDASISPGNSGAGVFNSQGELVGIVSAALTRPFHLTLGEGGDKLLANLFLSKGELPLGGSGLVIPANSAKKSMDSIVKYGTTRYGWLGVSLQSMDPLMKSSLKAGKGVLVASVVEDSPAQKAGFLEGDVIAEYDGRAVSDVKELVKMVKDTKPDKKVTVGIVRKGTKKNLNVKVGERPEEESSLKQFELNLPGGGDFLKATEGFLDKKEMEAEIKKLKEEVKSLKEELRKTKQEGGL